MEPPSTKSRALGTIWGACVGDALGGPIQFMKKGRFKLLTGMEYVKPFRKPAGSYSDDGAMTLALAQSFIDAKGSYNHITSIRYFLDWLFDGRFSTSNYAWDVGTSTRHALSIWKDNMWKDAEWRGDEECIRDVPATQVKVDNVLMVEECSGNGSLMRISPVGVVMWREEEEDLGAAVRAAREQSAITHPATACVEACALYTDLMGRVMKGETKAQLAQAVTSFPITHRTLAERLSKYPSLSDWQSQTDDHIRSSGWVIDTLEVALWAFFKYPDWKDGALAVVNLGGDSDTAGAIYGALAGAFCGVEEIPTEWVEVMQNRELIERVADGVANLVAPSS
ncbi:hypothetical protein AJ80_00501 [Polytolypa hystricis UAMH7299]|uniref:ADP-ribosylhydrolase ARH3 n=1 Tax=Polytolypa hystricis (strain UAMH7299) TaxID=1447883 RepID=A0A2B7YUH4_POLH7|nr:hypothetical protein AJ80_00501 [Polytolypa hystricis UAMH7299]